MVHSTEPWRQEHAGIVLTHWGGPPPTVLLIHGYKFDSRVWGSFAPRLAASGVHVVTIGWEVSSSPVRFADVVDEVRKAIPILDSVDVVVAEREGAAAAVDLALQGFTRGIILIGPIPDAIMREAEGEFTTSSDNLPPADTSGEADEALAALSEFIEHPERGVELLIDVAIREYVKFVAPEDVPLIRPMVEKYFRIDQPVLAVSKPLWVDRLREVDIPVLVTWPRASMASQERAIAARAPHGEGRPIDMHIPMPWLESPEQIINLMRDFLSSLG
jgi:pimeloyl-ACP methyl ester carboxylesterase